ncbi:MAG TPA: hypothetical protein VKZ68_01050 [Ohtaekwangia sp.]|nr:hypothetical protein [Ohtaekwangia sp.]
MPVATRPLEFVAFFSIEIATREGNAHVFLAVDAYLDYVFNLGVERTKDKETVLKNVYFLIEHPDFAKHLGNGFTLVLEDFQEFESQISNIIRPNGGTLLFDSPYHNQIIHPVLVSFRNMLFQKGK